MSNQVPAVFEFTGSATVEKSVDSSFAATAADVGEALLNAPSQSMYEIPENPPATGFLSKITKLKRSISDALYDDVNAEETDDGQASNKADNVDVDEIVGNAASDDGIVIGSRIVDEFIDFSDDYSDLPKDTKRRRADFKFKKNNLEGASREEKERICRDLIDDLAVVQENPAWFTPKDDEETRKNCFMDTNLVNILNREILDFARYISPTPEEHSMRKYVVRHIANSIYHIWPNSQMYVFGSFQTQLYLPEGDLDLVVLNVDKSGKGKNVIKRLHELARQLRRSGLANHVEVIPARVPIVKFVDRLVGFKVDISVNTETGINAAEYVGKVLKEHPGLRPMILVLKHFLQMRGLNEVFSGGLGSYGIFAMVVSFLQMHPKVRSKEIREEDNLGVLLIEFLDLYGKRFNYDKVGISLRGSGKYFVKGRLGNLSNDRPNSLTTEDPLETDNDITKGTFNLKIVCQAFSFAHDLLCSATYEHYHRQSKFRNFEIKSILGTIVRVSDICISFRKLIKDRFNKSQDDIEETFENGFVECLETDNVAAKRRKY